MSGSLSYKNTETQGYIRAVWPVSRDTRADLLVYLRYMTKFHVREMHVQGKHVSDIYLGYIGDSPGVTQFSAGLLQKIDSLQKNRQ